MGITIDKPASYREFSYFQPFSGRYGRFEGLLTDVIAIFGLNFLMIPVLTKGEFFI